MKQWYAKQLSTLTKVSVRTLHHYDRIDLLKPSVRLANGYRLYSEKDLLRLQQIIALKFFGFELAQIKVLLQSEISVIEQFTVQSQLLRQKASALLSASETLDTIVSNCNHDNSILWENIIKSIEVYRMTQELEQTWAGKVLSAEELKEYAAFRQSLNERAAEEKASFETAWKEMVATIEANLDKDPTSEFGEQLAKTSMERVNQLYGKERAHLRRKIWEQGFKKGHVNEQHGISQAAIDWLDKAIDAYYRKRFTVLFEQIGQISQEALLKQWDELLEDMYGYDEAAKDELKQLALKDNSVSEKAKQWIKKPLIFDILQIVARLKQSENQATIFYEHHQFVYLP